MSLENDYDHSWLMVFVLHTGAKSKSQCHRMMLMARSLTINQYLLSGSEGPRAARVVPADEYGGT